MAALSIIEGGQTLQEAMIRAGIERPPEHPEPGRLIRFSTSQDPRDKAGWVRVFDDGMGAVFGDWRSGIRGQWQANRRGQPMSRDERVVFAKKCEAAHRAREAERLKREELASGKAKWLYDQASTDGVAEHPYAAAKGVQLGSLIRRWAWPQRKWQDALLIPLYSERGGIIGLQAIGSDGEKDYLAGCAMRGAFHPFGKLRGAPRIVIGEGVATVAAVRESLNDIPAVAAMDAGNLPLVAEAVRRMSPWGEIIILADNDVRPVDSSLPNTGIEAAMQAARAVGAVVATPEMDGRKCDFWDLWHERGPEAVQASITAGTVIHRETDAWEPDGQDGLQEMPDGWDSIPDGWEDIGATGSESADAVLLMVRGAPASCAHNAAIWLSQSDHTFKRNEFTLGDEIDGEPITDTAIIKLLVEIQAKHRANLGKEHLHDGLTLLASRSPYHPIRDWLSALEWDGVERMEELFSMGMGAADTPYIRGCGRYILCSAVARAMEPGCKADCMIILEGEQGKFKSSAFIALFGREWHCENSTELGDKDFYLGLRGKWAVEFGELSGMAKNEQEAVKRLLTCTDDFYRPPYGRIAQSFPRQNIFCGTTNEHVYLKDGTGERRSLPVRIGTIDLSWIKENREQLFAEALTYWTAHKADWWEVPNATEEQSQRYAADPWEDDIAYHLATKTFSSIEDLMADPLKIDIDKRTHAQKLRVAKILQRLGWEGRPEWVANRTLRIYRKVR